LPLARYVTGDAILFLALSCWKMFMAAFSMCRRQSGVIRNGEVANFARNENYFDVCTQALRLLFVARDKALFSSPDQVC
jgi:hypothetical protein